MATIAGAITRDAVRQTAVAGGAAGSIVVAGVTANDKLVSVLSVDFVGGAITDLTSEFSPAAGAIDNTGGTATTGKTLLVTWLAVSD